MVYSTPGKTEGLSYARGIAVLNRARSFTSLFPAQFFLGRCPVVVDTLTVRVIRSSSAAVEGSRHDEQRRLRRHGPGGEVDPPRQVQEGQGEVF